MNRMLNDFESDALKEAGNIGMSHAANSLSEMINKKVTIEVPELNLAPINEIKKIGMLEGSIVGLSLPIEGEISGDILITFSKKNALSLARILTGQEDVNDDNFSPMEISALKETGNILGTHFSNSLTDLLELTIRPSLPNFIEDTIENIIEYTTKNWKHKAEYSLIFNTKFSAVNDDIYGSFFLLMDSGSLELILSALKTKLGM